MKVKFIADGLIPCPFCGGTGTLQADAHHDCSFVYVSCDVCGARSKTLWTPIPYEREDENEPKYDNGPNSVLTQAKSLWNRRVNS